MLTAPLAGTYRGSPSYVHVLTRTMAAGHDIAMALRSAYWAMHRRTDALLAPDGLTAHQFVLLSLLAGGDGVTQQELVRRAASDANTVRAMLLLREERGLVSRPPHPTDGRARSVTLTPAGRRTFQRLWDRTEVVRTTIESLFPTELGEALLDSLRQISEATPPATTRKKRDRTSRPIRRRTKLGATR